MKTRLRRRWLVCVVLGASGSFGACGPVSRVVPAVPIGPPTPPVAIAPAATGDIAAVLDAPSAWWTPDSPADAGDPPSPALNQGLAIVPPVDVMGPRCLVCPSVQPDPTTPVVGVPKGAAPVVSSVRTTDPVVFITIDDGENQYDDAAALLDMARVPFTLFLTQRYVADKYPYMRRLVHAGGWVEDHTYSHVNLARTAPTTHEVCSPLDGYEREFGHRSTLFRPPYGNSTPAVQSLVGSCGMDAVILWRASMNYGALATQGGPLRAGDIVLMHFRPDLHDNLLELFRVANDAGLKIGRLECYVGGDPRCGQPWR